MARKATRSLPYRGLQTRWSRRLEIGIYRQRSRMATRFPRWTICRRRTTRTACHRGFIYTRSLGADARCVVCAAHVYLIDELGRTANWGQRTWLGRHVRFGLHHVDLYCKGLCTELEDIQYMNNGSRAERRELSVILSTRSVTELCLLSNREHLQHLALLVYVHITASSSPTSIAAIAMRSLSSPAVVLGDTGLFMIFYDTVSLYCPS